MGIPYKSVSRRRADDLRSSRETALPWPAGPPSAESTASPIPVMADLRTSVPPCETRLHFCPVWLLQSQMDHKSLTRRPRSLRRRKSSIPEQRLTVCECPDHACLRFSQFLRIQRELQQPLVSWVVVHWRIFASWLRCSLVRLPRIGYPVTSDTEQDTRCLSRRFSTFR